MSDETLKASLDEIQADGRLRIVNKPTEVVERQIEKLRRKHTSISKIGWNARRGSKFVWEPDDAMRKK